MIFAEKFICVCTHARMCEIYLSRLKCKKKLCIFRSTTLLANSKPAEDRWISPSSRPWRDDEGRQDESVYLRYSHLCKNKAKKVSLLLIHASTRTNKNSLIQYPIFIWLYVLKGTYIIFTYFTLKKLLIFFLSIRRNCLQNKI